MENSLELLEKLRRTELLRWLPPEGAEMFQNCFDLETVRLRAGETLDSAGRLGLVLSGGLRRGDRLLGPGTLFGAVRQQAGPAHPEPVSLSAERDSEVALWDGAVLTSVCYRACWFHGRFVLEAERAL